MEWRERWWVTLKTQSSFNPITVGMLKSGLIWGVILSVLRLLCALSESTPINVVMGRLWIVFLFGLFLFFLIYVVRLLSPSNVSFGPNGIVRVKAD